MKNKDLFEAIDRIDDDILNSAGKYLEPEGFIDTTPVEVRPASKKTSMIKIIAPIAAAIAVVCGVAVVAGTQRPSTYSPGAAGADITDSEDASSDIVDGDETSDTSDSESDDTSSGSGDVDETSAPTENETSQSDPHSHDHLYDVDEKYLPIGLDGIKLTNNDGTHYVINDTPNGERLPDDEWEYGGFMTNFVYYADPKGANYNSADNPEAFAEGFVSDNSATFKRIAKDDKFGSLTVANGSYTTYARDRENSPNDAPIYYHGSSNLNFNGWSMIEDAYLVKSEDIYYCILRNGATPLPIINATTLDDGSYGALPFEGNLGGLEYKTEIPPIVVRLRENQQKVMDEYFEDHSYVKARVHITDIDMWCYPGDWYKIYSEGDVISIQSGDAEPKEVAAVINAQTSASELKAALMEKFGFTDVRVQVYNSNGDIIDDEINVLIPGMMVAVYDENGFCGRYTYGDHK